MPSVMANVDSGLSVGLYPANEKRRYKVTPSLIALAGRKPRVCPDLWTRNSPKVYIHMVAVQMLTLLKNIYTVRVSVRNMGQQMSGPDSSNG